MEGGFRIGTDGTDGTQGARLDLVGGGSWFLRTLWQRGWTLAVQVGVGA